jgi:hypothetical protein
MIAWKLFELVLAMVGGAVVAALVFLLVLCALTEFLEDRESGEGL